MIKYEKRSFGSGDGQTINFEIDGVGIDIEFIYSDNEIEVDFTYYGEYSNIKNDSLDLTKKQATEIRDLMNKFLGE